MSSKCVADFRDLSIGALRQAGCRITKQRTAVIDCISKAKKPLSAPEVYETLSKRAKGAPIDIVSVYRALETLLALNLVHRVSPNGAYIACSHQDCPGFHHIMSRCKKCDEVKELDVPHEVVASLLFHMRNSFDFTPDSHLLHMEGICSTCGK